jgi:hypothetical protein
VPSLNNLLRLSMLRVACNKITTEQKQQRGG